MIIVSDSHEWVLRETFSKHFFEALSNLENEERIIIGLSWGSSFDIFYRELSENFHKIPEKIREKIYFAFLDERVVPPAHPERNEFQLRQKFLTKLLVDWLIREEQILSVDIGVDDIAWTYSPKVPKIHIGFFGVGPDGHIASLFPHHPLLQSGTQWYLEIKDSPKPPPHRITVSPRMIWGMNSLFVAFMKGKEMVYRSFLDENITFHECPAKLLSPGKNRVLLSNIDRYNF